MNGWFHLQKKLYFAVKNPFNVVFAGLSSRFYQCTNSIPIRTFYCIVQLDLNVFHFKKLDSSWSHKPLRFRR